MPDAVRAGGAAQIAITTRGWAGVSEAESVLEREAHVDPVKAWRLRDRAAG